MIRRTHFGLALACLALGMNGSVKAADTPEYTATEAAKHVGETATVTGKVEDAYQAKGGNIFLNMGGRHPNEIFTVFVPASAAAEFKDVKMYDGKTISVTGKIEEHKDKPEITVRAPSDITIKGDEQSAASPAASASPAPAATP
jgi:DNA/RNA endonuclease YhcR with UshA esterase domain